MKVANSFAKRVGILALTLMGLAIVAAPASAQIESAAEASVTLHKKGAAFILEFNGVTRRAVIDKLFASNGASVSWSDNAGADEPVRGRATGTIDQIMATLLPRYNYVIVRRPVAGKLRVASVIILGPSSRLPEERPPQIVASVRTERKGSPIEQYFQAQQAQAAQLAPPVAVRK